MNAETIKALFTYLIALLLIAGGLAFLYFSRNDPSTSNTAALIPLVAGFIGAAIQFVFNRETQTQTARQVERGIAQGTSSQPTVQTGGNPPTTTVVPPPIPDPGPGG